MNWTKFGGGHGGKVKNSSVRMKYGLFLPSLSLDSSNRSLWQVVTGHSALRDHVRHPTYNVLAISVVFQALIERELRDALPRLKEGVAYYKPPSPASEKRIEDGGTVKGNKLILVLEISSHLVGVACYHAN